PKCRIVVYHNLKTAPAVQWSGFCLYTGAPVPTAAEYKYLGVWMQADVGWSAQAKAVLKKSSYVALLIRKVIVQGRFPAPRVVICLLRALLIPVIEYGLMFWAPTLAQAWSLTSIITTVVRCSLGLPR